ncbi:MAG: hypothetical protein LBU11_09820, partial [Zoogloeaceae bacterium]|nr:hypothetical protein [Zoogloeaceae bacterium]
RTRQNVKNRSPDARKTLTKCCKKTTATRDKPEPIYLAKTLELSRAASTGSPEGLPLISCSRILCIYKA